MSEQRSPDFSEPPADAWSSLRRSVLWFVLCIPNAEYGGMVGVVCLTSPDLVFRSFRGVDVDPSRTNIVDVLLPAAHPARW
jgi:hypothetical protein